MKVDDVVVVHPNASRRHIQSDRPWLRRAVDAVDRILVALVEIKRARAERIVRSAWLTTSPLPGAGLAGDHLGGWRPGRPLGRASNTHDACPSEALSADAYSIPDRLLARLHQVEKVLISIDDDRTGLLGGPKLDDLHAKRFGHLLVRPVIFVRQGA